MKRLKMKNQMIFFVYFYGHYDLKLILSSFPFQIAGELNGESDEGVLDEDEKRQSDDLDDDV